MPPRGGERSVDSNPRPVHSDDRRVRRKERPLDGVARRNGTQEALDVHVPAQRSERRSVGGLEHPGETSANAPGAQRRTVASGGHLDNPGPLPHPFRVTTRDGARQGAARPYTVAFARPHPFGFLVGIELPDSREPVPDAVLRQLDLREREIADNLRGFRRVQWVGGRLAAQAAARHFGVTAWSLARGPAGEPRPPSGFSTSIAHKRRLAVALVIDAPDVDLGVDVENDLDAARSIAGDFLCASEARAIERLPAADRDPARVLAFALKEAAYKALGVHMGKALAYRDARVVVRLPLGGFDPHANRRGRSPARAGGLVRVARRACHRRGAGGAPKPVAKPIE